MNNQKGSTTLVVMVIVAVAALLFGFLVIRQRIKTPPPLNQSQNTSPDQTSNQDQPVPDQSSLSPVSIPSTWQTYSNTKYGFELKYPPSLKAGSVSGNSALGTYQVPIKGFHVGTLVFVVLKDMSIKQQANDYFNGFYDEALHPQTNSGSEGGTTACTIDKIRNSSVVSVKSVSCSGEGGAAQYAYIKGSSYDVFVDGYSAGYDHQDNGKLASGDYIKILASFKFGTSTSSTTNTNNSTPPANNNQTQQSSIQTFSITADDSTAAPSEINVLAGTIVEITFNVSSTNVYYGGLDFRSLVVNSGTIYSGQSKTISFKADHSFAFTPYWPASNVAKGYTVKVTVQ